MKRILMLLMLFSLSASCKNKNEAPNADPPTPAEPAGEPDHDHASEPGTDLKLEAVMAKLGTDMNSVQNALWRNDFDGIAKSAHDIAEHPHVGPTDLARIKKTLGKEMANFAAHDKRVHDGATRLAVASKEKKMDVVLKEIAEIQSGCIACHSQFQQRLRR